MDTNMLQELLMWCSIINGILLIITTLMVTFFGNTVFKLHSLLYPISRDAFNIAMYSMVGIFKIVWLVFNLVPYIALVIIRS